jgi:hypothetical protein
MSKINILTDLPNEQMLAEVEDVIRSMPDRGTLHHDSDDVLTWLGRALAAINNWSLAHGAAASTAVESIRSPSALDSWPGSSKLLILLRQAQSDLRLKTVGPVNVAIGAREVFRYFDSLRKIIEEAKKDLLFVDRYLNADFVSTYLPSVANGVTVRLLARDKIPALAAATSAFAKQHGTAIEVRSAQNFHDRWVFVDRASCYFSGASFKDGGGKDSTILVQNVDAFSAVHSTYENIWQSATVHPV